MTATQTTTDRIPIGNHAELLSTSSTTSLARPNHPHGMFQSKPPPRFCAHAHPTASNPRQNHAPNIRVTALRPAVARRLDPPPARSLSPLRLSLLLFDPSSVTTSVRHLSHHRP